MYIVKEDIEFSIGRFFLYDKDLSIFSHLFYLSYECVCVCVCVNVGKTER